MLCEGWTGNTLDAGVLHGGGRGDGGSLSFGGVRVIRRLEFEPEQVPGIRLAPSASRLNPLIFPTVHSPFPATHSKIFQTRVRL